MTLCLVLAGLNLGIGTFVAALKLPVYLDSLGIFISTILLGPIYGLVCVAVTVGVGFFSINPYLPYYFFTGAGIVVSVYLLYRSGWYSSVFKTLVSGVIVALVAATLSAPVTAYLFGGVTLTGNDALTSFLLATGKTLLESVILSGVSSELVDKIVLSLATYYTLLAIPEKLLGHFGIDRGN